MGNQRRSIIRELKLHAMLLGGLLLMMWTLELADFVFFWGGLDTYGIRPRTVDGLRGIAFAPFLHRGFTHLAGNSILFFALGWLILLHNIRDFVIVTLLALLVSGLGVWLLGASRSVHIGASGVIFGYLGCLLLRGYFQRSVGAILLSLLVSAVYGGLLWGILPFAVGISWEGHLFGFLGGVLAAYLLRRRAPPRVNRMGPTAQR
jgi:membrane associated rhomboid family serine protease